jgi:3-oxoacyl-[acyl-carrier protein] reductase
VPAFSVDLENHSAIVTGAGAGVGRATALALARCGAAVTVNDLNPDRADSVAAEIHATGGRSFAFQGDVSNRFQAAALIEQSRERFGQIHILVNAAGVYKPGEMALVDEWDWRRQIDVNLTGVFFCSQLIGRVMADEGGGVIVNVAASAAGGTLPGGVGYIASKSGVIGLTRQSARELAAAGVRVNAVCPGNIAEDDSPADEPTNMLNRAGTPEEVADVVLFLCSDAARFITGQAIHVDGGALMMGG